MTPPSFGPQLERTMHLRSSRLWQGCRVRYLFFGQLWLSMEHHVRVSIIAPGWGSVNLSLHITRRNWATLIEKGEVDLLQPWNDFDSNPLVGTSIF